MRMLQQPAWIVAFSRELINLENGVLEIAGGTRMMLNRKGYLTPSCAQPTASTRIQEEHHGEGVLYEIVVAPIPNTVANRTLNSKSGNRPLVGFDALYRNVAIEEFGQFHVGV